MPPVRGQPHPGGAASTWPPPVLAPDPVDPRRCQPPGMRPEGSSRRGNPHHPHFARPLRTIPQSREAVRPCARRPGISSVRGGPKTPATARSGNAPARAEPNPARQVTPLAGHSFRPAACGGVVVAELRRARHEGMAAGHGLAALLRVHANRIDDQAAEASRRISDGLGQHDSGEGR
jgi:hypothetical protein